MPVTESTSQRLVLVSGSTTLTLDKDARKACLQRKLLFWKLKPTELPLSDFSSIALDKAVDRGFGCRDLSHHADHAGRRRLGLPARDKQEARSRTPQRSARSLSCTLSNDKFARGLRPTIVPTTDSRARYLEAACDD